MSSLQHRFPATDMPVGLMLGLVALGLPRTVLVDLGVLEPEGSLVYYVLALVPFAAWLAVAVARRSRRPFLDFVVLGALQRLSLVIVHNVFWDIGPGLGHEPPASAVRFADGFDPQWREPALRAYTAGIAMMIGLGTGVLTALVAVAANLWRSRRSTTS